MDKELWYTLITAWLYVIVFGSVMIWAMVTHPTKPINQPLLAEYVAQHLETK